VKKIDVLLHKARVLIVDSLAVFFPDNADSFMEALNVEPAHYVVSLSDGTEGYDFMKALNDTAATDWVDHEQLEADEMEAGLVIDKLDKSQNPDELTEEECWELIKKPAEKPEQKVVKTRNLFGWG